MFDRYLRQFKDSLLLPLSQTVFRSTPPLAITGVGLGVGLGSALAAGMGSDRLSLGLWLLNRILDGLDGSVARLQNRQSDLGGYLDMLADVVVYAAVPMGIAFHLNTIEGYQSLACLLGSFYLNLCAWMYLSALLEKRRHGSEDEPAIQTSIRMPSGWIEGAETIVFYSLFLLFPQHSVVLFGIMAGLVLLSVVQRVIWAGQHL